MLYELLARTDPLGADKYLSRGFKLVNDTLRECRTPRAELNEGKVNFGEGGWETILQVGLLSYAVWFGQRLTPSNQAFHYQR